MKKLLELIFHKFTKVFIQKLDIDNKIIKDNNEKLEKSQNTINDLSGKNIYTDVDDDFLYVINKAIEYHQLSNLYDITIGPLTNLWNISNQAEYCSITNSCHIPTLEKINNVKKLININNIDINNHKILLKEEGMKLDFGSIAKGFAIDKINELIINYFKENYQDEERFFIINFGGSINYHGNTTNYENKYGELYISYNDINNPSDSLINIYPNKNNIVSSGNMERYIIVDDVKYSHILSPITGYPIETNLSLVSIMNDTNIDADCLSTILYMEGIEFINKLKELNTDYLIIDKDYNIYISSNIKYKLLNSNYQIHIIQ